MSHFSKIQTNISDLEILKKTINDLGFECNLGITDQDINNLYVYQASNTGTSVFHFAWDGLKYVLMADFMLWSLTTSIESFVEKLSQRYAYNMILKQGECNGFSKQTYTVTADGSIRLVMQRWSN